MVSPYAPTQVSPLTRTEWCGSGGTDVVGCVGSHQGGIPATEWDPILPIGVPKTRRNWLMVGNQAVRLQCSNDGTVALFDETYGLRWLTAPDPVGTGVSVIVDGKHWSSEYSQRAG